MAHLEPRGSWVPWPWPIFSARKSKHKALKADCQHQSNVSKFLRRNFCFGTHDNWPYLLPNNLYYRRSLSYLSLNPSTPELTNSSRSFVSSNDSRSTCSDDHRTSSTLHLRNTYKSPEDTLDIPYQISDLALDAPLCTVHQGTSINGNKNISNSATLVSIHNLSSTSTFRVHLTDDVAPEKHNPLRRKKPVADLRAARYCFTSDIALNYFQDYESRTLSQQELGASLAEYDGLIQTLDHFRSFCILATEASVDPAFYASQGIYSLEDVPSDEEVQLNMQLDDYKVSEILTGVDDDGNETAYLALIGKLLAPITGRHLYTLVSLLNIRDFLDAVTLEDTELERTPDDVEMPAEDSPNETGSICSTDGNGSDLWMEIASNASQGSQNSGEVYDRESSQAFGEFLEEFTGRLISLYRDSFLLARSRVDAAFYEISYISPSMYADGEYIADHFKHTPSDARQELGRLFGGDERFDIEIRWGSSGLAKRMYCAPAFGGTSRAWLCTLVNIDAPHLWRGEVSLGNSA